MKKILYLHGLEGKLSEEKRVILEKYGEVYAPDIDYRKEFIIRDLIHFQEIIQADYIVGSSMGGYAGYILSKISDKNCLLFNPAFSYRSMQPDLRATEIPETKNSLTYIVLGKLDLVVNYADNKDFIIKNFSSKQLKLKEIEKLEHRIPLEIFAQMTDWFFEDLQRT